MKSLIMIIALLVTSMTLPSPVATPDNDCDAIAGYLDEIDDAMATEIHALVTRPGWAEDARTASLALAQGSPDDGASDIDLDPIIEFMAIPEDVLSAMDEDAIPDGALPLHESALGFWTTFPSWFSASAADDPDAMEAANAAILAASEDNMDAQVAIDEACPGLLDNWFDQSDNPGALLDLLEEEDGNLEALTNASVEDFEGIGIQFLTMPASMGFVLQPVPTVAPISTPAT